MNCFAESFAASNRLGSMSSASMDQDTSMATTTVALSRGWFA